MPSPRQKPKDDTGSVRCLRLAQWLLTQDEPASRERIYAAFPDEYRGSAAATEKKFSRDKVLLRKLGFALETVELGGRGEATGYVLDARSSALPLIEFTPEEAASVWAAGAGLLRLSNHPLRNELESALRKLAVGGKGLPPRAANTEELSAVGEAVDQQKALGKLDEAWERRKSIDIDYWRAGTGEVVPRRVDVYGWALRRGEWIFVGRCHLRDAVRIFYLSRCRSLRMNGVRAQDPDYAIPDGFDIKQWSRQHIWDYQVHAPRTAAVRFRGSLARLARQLLPGARVSSDPDGARVARLEVRNLRGLVRQVLAWGLEAELIEPTEGRAMAREMLETVVRATERVSR
jgi:proteasome accessory factor B